MSVTNPERVVTKQDLADFYDELLPFISPKSYAGFTPIGTVIHLIAESAPANYLICDGATYNKSDYPELAAHLLSMTSHSMYEVSGDATKFKVPDLRGEFLRGTGTNGHSTCGNGADVGVHQNATYHLRNQTANGGSLYLSADGTGVGNPDVEIKGTGQVYSKLSVDTSSTNMLQRYASRPTNTSVLFCIATKNIYLDPKNDYSTEEKVIGTWINGTTIYQKTINVPSITLTTARGTRVVTTIDVSALNIDTVVDINPIFSVSTTTVTNTLKGCVFSDSGTPCAGVQVNISNKSTLNVTNSMWDAASLTGANAVITIQYTKTS